jgi:hypothetical protein
MMMDLSLTRAAQSAYNKAGFPRDEAFERGEEIARYVHENLDVVQKLYHLDDEIELAYRVALAMVKYEADKPGN